MLYTAKKQTQGLLKYAQDPRARVPFGFPTIDTKVLRNGGLAPGDVAMVIGRSEVGKTWLLTNILWHIVKTGVPVLDVSLEMSQPQKTLRMAQVAYEVGDRTFEQGLKDALPGSMDLLSEFEKDFPNYAVYKPDDVEGAGFDEIDRAMDEFHQEYGEPPRVVALDFLGLMKREQYDGQDVVRIPKLAAQAERWADVRETSLILLHQTGRMNEGDPTRRNHGHIPLDATDAHYGGESHMDYMFGIYRPARLPPPSGTDVTPEEQAEWETFVYEQRNKSYLQVLKNRHAARPVEQQYPGIELEASWPSGRLKEVNPPIANTSRRANVVPLRQSGAAYSVPKKDKD